MKKEEILAKAKDIISNDRNESHGDAFKNHAEIAEFWNIFLDGKLQPMASITAQDVAIMMILLKFHVPIRERNLTWITLLTWQVIQQLQER